MAFKIISFTRCRDEAGNEYKHMECGTKTTDTLPTEGIPDGSGIELYDPTDGKTSRKHFDADAGAWV